MNTTRSIRTPALLLAVIALVLAGLTLPAQAATKTASVKGVVTLDGKPVKGVKVELVWIGADSFSGPSLGVHTTNSKGAYSFSKFPVEDKDDEDLGGKAVIVTDPSGRIVATSRRFSDRPGKTLTRNVSVKRAASITGVVKRGDGVVTTRLRTEVSGPDVQIDSGYDSDPVYDTSVPIAKDGSFTLKGLPAGEYNLQFVDDGKTYFPQCYDNLPRITSACGGTAITVTAGQNLTLNPQTLTTKGRRISGTVTDTSGRPIRNAGVRTIEQDQQKRLEADTSRSGRFTLGPATGGTYRLEVDPGKLWAPLSASTVYDVTGQDATGIQIKLKSRAHINAKLTPGNGTAKIAVDIFRTATRSKLNGKLTISSGTVTKTTNLVKGKATVTLRGLPKGKRTITVSYAGTSSTAATTKTFRTTVK
ncbi:MAG: carboxypeptidase regulatory-like domain-containing protein [Aeromicrobium sp.]